jgi:hypothetical protein
MSITGFPNQQFNITKKQQRIRRKKRRFAAAQGIGGVRQPRCEAPGPERQRSPEKPGFRREAPEMRPIFLKKFRNVKLPALFQGGFSKKVKTVII